MGYAYASDPQPGDEAGSQSDDIKNRISTHHNSSPTSMIAALDQFAKGATAIMHRVALLEAEASALRKANEALSKRRRAKKTRVRLGGSLTVQDAQNLLDQKDLDEQLRKEERQSGGQGRGARTKVSRCSNCGGTDHNVRTCQNATEGPN